MNVRNKTARNWVTDLFAVCCKVRPLASCPFLPLTVLSSALAGIIPSFPASRWLLSLSAIRTGPKETVEMGRGLFYHSL